MISTRVQVKQGIVRGCEEKMFDGSSFLRFSGIPYAKPPINELRFRAPQKLEKFNQEEIDCTKDGNACYSPSFYLHKLIGSEDCLYLNVFVPTNATSGSPLPVMFYIHGGGFNFDSSAFEWYSPEHLLMENVIVVTLNYRLHVLGFLSLPSMGISGNAGLKDQQCALEWVHENISNFNGDPNNICLFGESAGGASVHLQVMNTKSRTLIKSAILQSGCALGDWVIQRDGIGVTRKLAKFLGCKGEDDKSIYDTLMNASVDDLFKLKSKPQDPDERRRNLNFTFKPTIEPESKEAFISKPPSELIKFQKDQMTVAIMAGTTVSDGNAMCAAYKSMTELFDKDPVKLVPRSIKINPDMAIAKVLGEEIKRFYFGSKPICPETVPQLVDHMTDFHFLVPQTIANELHCRYQRNSKLFLYEFHFDGELNHYKKFLDMQDIPGAGHADDVCYLFNQRAVGTLVDPNSRSGKMRKTLCQLWANFAKYQDPTPDHDSPLPFKWNSVQSVDPNTRDIDFDYLVIDEDSKMVRNINKKRLDFWRAVYQKYNSSFLAPKL